MQKHYLFLFFTLFLSQIYLFSQKNEAYYLKKIEQTKSDTTKINLYFELFNLISDSKPERAIELLSKAEKLVHKSNFKLYFLYSAYTKTYTDLCLFKKAIKYAFLTLKQTPHLNASMKNLFEGSSYERLATIYTELGNYKLALEYQIKAIDCYKKIMYQSKADEIYYYASYLNLANNFKELDKVDKAIYYYLFVEENLIKLKDKDYLSYTYNGLASCYSSKNQNLKALEYYEKSKNAVLKFTPNDLSSLAVAMNNIGIVQVQLKNNIAAVINYSEALEIFKKLKDQNSISISYYNLAMVYSNLKQYDQSNKYMLDYLMLKDSIFDQDTKQTIHDLSIKYESEKKEQQNKILEKENEKKLLSLYFLIAGIVLILIILLIIYRNSQIKTKINKELAIKNDIIEEQKMLVEEQHKEITDSIKYAERIQGAILPPEQKWQQILPNSFVLNKPKDILSGDFYWIVETESYIFIAAADCTGHGVPGALISIVNFNLLNKAVLERGLILPSDILDAVNTWLTESLNQTVEESSIKDGMDIALISINRTNGEVLFSGANNPLYLFSNNELIEYKADKHPVGAFIDENIQHFTTKEIPTKFGDTIYLFSDGYADQFGGTNGKKYKYKQLKEQLFMAKDLPIIKQKEYLNNQFKIWKGKYEQTDDVLIIGINFV